MVEIKEEDIGVQSIFGKDEIIIKVKDSKNIKQLKQQILQDHEDAKKYRDLIKGNSILFGDKEWILEQSKHAKKDRQIVKRLEEQIKELQEYIVEPHTSMEVKLQKILEGEK